MAPLAPKTTKAPALPPKNSSLKTKEAKTLKKPRVEEVAEPKPSTKERAQQPLSSKSKGKQKAARTETVASKPTKQAAAPLPTAFKIIVGSYEKLLYGLSGSVSLAPSSSSTSFKVTLKPQFIFPAHVSSIKAVGASTEGGKWLASGSADEIIKVWDLRRRKEVGGLMHHTGSITQLTFPSRSHLLSCSEDGTLALFHTRDWELLRVLKGHTGRVNAVAVHPSGKLALSAGKDKTLRMWDLMRGRGAASTKLGYEGERVAWDRQGKVFAVSAGRRIDVYDTRMVLVHTITHSARTHDILFVPHPHRADTNVLLVAAEDKKVGAYVVSVPESASEELPPPPTLLAEFVGHANRVKALAVLPIALPTSSSQPRESTTILTTISSDGKVFVYDLHALPNGTGAQTTEGQVPVVQPLAEYDTDGTRLTCLTIAEDVATTAPAEKDERKIGSKNKRREDEEEESEVGGDGDADEDESDQWEDEDEVEGEEEEGEEEEEED